MFHNDTPMNWPLSTIASYFAGNAIDSDQLIANVSTDTRTINEGDLFVALVGENFDGHDYIQDAVEKGARCVMVSRPVVTDVPVILVDDTLVGYGLLAHHWRCQFDIPMIAVTGSCGKTSVKELMKSILFAHISYSLPNAADQAVLATEFNFNNEIGVPKTLLKLRAHHKYAVIEMGAGQKGDIAYLTKLAQPSIRVLTNASPAHLERLGSLEGIAETKGEILVDYPSLSDAFNKHTVVNVLNRDDQFFETWQQRADGEMVSFGVHHQSDFQVMPHATQTKIPVEVEIKLSSGETLNILTDVLGQHNALNIAAAVAAVSTLGVSSQAIKNGVAEFKPIQGRLCRMTHETGAVIFDDTYNANPTSVKAAIDVLVQESNQKILVLGEMAELGDEAAQLHHEIALYAKQKGVNKLFSVGPFARVMSESFGKGAHSFDDCESAIPQLSQYLDQEHSILVKGSRVSKMERVINSLLNIEKGEVSLC